MEPEAACLPEEPRRPALRRRAVAVAGVAVGLAVALVVGVAPRSGAKARRAPAALPATPGNESGQTTAAPQPVITSPASTAALVLAETVVPAPAPAVTTPTTRAARTVPPSTAAPVPLTFEGRLDQALAGTPGCLVVEENGAPVYERNPTSPFVPASSQKLMVAAAILARLGPDFRYETRVMAPQPPGTDGRLVDAWLVGAGDPFLATPDYIGYAAGKPRLNTLPLTPLTALANGLVAAGVRDIPGGLLADETRYDTQRSVPSWKPSYVREAEVGSLGALTVNEGLASWGPSQAVAPDPAASATGALTRMLQERGVTVPPPGPAAGPPSGAVAPDGAVVVASVRSAPLADIVAATVRASDNYAAEMLLRELDRQTGGAGSTAGGAARVVDEMARAGVATEGVHLNDGSGLDLGNRSTCRALLGALSLSSRPGLSAVDDGLAVAGRTGTLATRFVGTPVEGRLAAKTGWLSGAAALVGRIDGLALNTRAARRFALVVNGPFNFATAKALQDRVVTVLAEAPS